MISCSEAVQRLWDYLENDVEAAERDRVEEHLAFCRRCCGELEFAEQLRGVLADAADVGIPSDVEARLTNVIDDLQHLPEDATDHVRPPHKETSNPDGRGGPR